MLENTLYKLNNGNEFTVGYFGGSITEGAGSSEYSKCWAGLFTEWLKSEYKNCKINEIRAAIGGTGSSFGLYRCDEQLLAYKPDLVFFEFATNDSGWGYEECSKNAEGIFRKILNSNPYADIIVVYTLTNAMAASIENGNVLESRAAQSHIAYYYGDILQIEIGEALRKKVYENGGDWLKFTKEGVHPNDDGYAIYFETIKKKVTEAFNKADKINQPVIRELPPAIYSRELEMAHMEDIWNFTLNEKWKRIDKSLCGRYPHYIEATEPGATLELKFTGTRCELFWMMAKDSGDIIYTCDGGEEMTRSSWDSYCLNFNRANAHWLARNLPYGEHILKLRISENKNEKSEGTAIRIAALLVQ